MSNNNHLTLIQLAEGKIDISDVSDTVYDMVYDHFFDDLPHHIQNGDGGTLEDWLEDNQNRLMELI